jgi:hypothetical protein
MAEMLTKPWRKGGLPVAGSPLIAVLFAVVLVACLYVGREVLVPIALAVLMSFVLAPLVRLLQNWYVPRGLAYRFRQAIAARNRREDSCSRHASDARGIARPGFGRERYPHRGAWLRRPRPRSLQA